MLIVHSDGYGLTNFDNVTEINVAGRYIHAYCVDGKHNIIGTYEDESKALQAFSKMLMECSVGRSNVITIGAD